MSSDPRAGPEPGCASDLEAVRDWPPLGSGPEVLLVWPRFPPSFWGFEGMMRILPEKSVMPPLGLITVAALCPPLWRVRLIDCACQPLLDADIARAGLVMVSAMHAQRADVRAILTRCRRLGTRTIIGGPYASSQPDAVLPLADHVVVGEVDEAFAGIARDLERGLARRLYRCAIKPDLTVSPMPRFDLLRLDDYASMSVQFSRGCPFECEFCDIITIYGRRPRAKSSQQLLAELDRLRTLGWRKQVFIVDDNFIGNRRAALSFTQELIAWQERHGRPFSFYTEASIDLATSDGLLDAMVAANFLYVFIGIETTSETALREVRKFQNLRRNTFEQVRKIQKRGLWVTGGFIVGFDADDQGVFRQQIDFIERVGIPWAMTGMLQAPPTTALFDRLEREGRLLADSEATTNFSPPNFRTVLGEDILIGGMRQMLLELYDPERFFARAMRSLECWNPRPSQRPPLLSRPYRVRVALASIWHQGLRSSYRRAYWRFFATLTIRCRREPVKFWKAFVLLISAHHFLSYARETADELQQYRHPRGGDAAVGDATT